MKPEFYDVSKVRPVSGDCMLTPRFRPTDARAEGERLVDWLNTRLCLSQRLNAVVTNELASMIAATIQGAVDAATGRTDKFAEVRERAAVERGKRKPRRGKR